MNTPVPCPSLRTSVVAVRTALCLLAAGLVASPAAFADAAPDAAVAALVKPASTVEVGVGAVSDASAKANEYSGLSKKGAYLIGNVDLRGGGAYDSDDASRWRLVGRDLGTEARELSGEYGVQGRFRISFGYSELLRNRSDSYQTPLLGAGSNVLTLPSTWIVPLVPRLSGTAANARGLSSDVTASNGLVSGVSTAPTGAQLATAASLQAADLPSFQAVQLYTKRTAYELGLLVPIDRQWQITASFRHEDKQGLKPMGTVTRATGGDISSIIPDLIDTATELLNLGAQFQGEKLTLQAGYHGSLFSNHVPSMTWSNWALPGNAQTMSSTPSNQFHQLTLTGGYSFAPGTRLVGNFSYGRNTQNDSFLTAAYTPLVPVASLNGEVVSKQFSLKLSARPMRGLNLAAGYKYDLRDNRTPVNTYGFYDAGEAKSATASAFSAAFPTAGLGSNANLNANRPYSRKFNQLGFDADYQLAPGHALKAALEGQVTDHYCNGTWIACTDADQTKEATLKLEYRLTALDNLSARVGWQHAHRTVNYNEDAWLALVPMANVAPTGATGYNAAYGTAYSTMLALGYTGYGPVSGLNPLPTANTAAAFFFANNNALANALYANQNRISELPGMRRFNLADRNRDKLRASADWQATEMLSLQAGLDINHDDYSHSVYGLQKATSWALNLEASLALNEATTLAVFATQENQRSQSAGNTYTANSTATNVAGFTTISGGCFATIALRNASNKVDPCLNWRNDMRDEVNTLGLSYSQRGLAGGRLDLSAALSYSEARSSNDVTGGNYANNPAAVAGAPAGTVAAYYIAATPLPVVRTDTTELRLGARYALTPQQALRVGYRYQHMRSTDWAYDGLQIGGLAGVLPTLEQAPSYTVHTLSLGYTYSF